MKQRITIEQLNELSLVQKERLRNWWKPQEGEYFVESGNEYLYAIIPSGYENLGYKPEYKALPLLSIGQMIEFLEDMKAFEGEDDALMPSSGRVLLYWEDKDRDDELADALWDDVKQVLMKSAIH